MILNLKKTAEIQKAIDAILAITSISDVSKKEAISKIDTAEVTADTLVDAINSHPTENNIEIIITEKKTQIFEILEEEISDEVELKLTDLIESGYLEEMDSEDPTFRVFNNLSLSQSEPRVYDSIESLINKETVVEEKGEVEEEVVDIDETDGLGGFNNPSSSFRQL